MSRSPMINQMKVHQDRAILKAKLMADDPLHHQALANSCCLRVSRVNQLEESRK